MCGKGVNIGSSWLTDLGFRKSPGVQVPVLSLSFGSIGGGERDFCSRCSWRSKFPSLCMLQLHHLWFQYAVNEKQLSVSLNRTEPF